MQRILDERKQKQIIGILAIGGTRTLAAQLVGCHPRTITNAARDDAKFAEDLNRAETCPEYNLLKTVADSGRHLPHLAKWALERMYPDRYRPRAPGTFSVDAVKQFLLTLAARLADQAANDDERQRVLSGIAQFGREVIVNTQPFVEQALTLLSELELPTEDVPVDQPADAQDTQQTPPVKEFSDE